MIEIFMIENRKLKIENVIMLCYVINLLRATTNL
jgi:hypothetical protein